MKKTSMTLFLIVFSICLSSTSPALAYLDPGTGSMILQLLLGGIAGALVIIKLYWQKLKGIFGAKVEPSPPKSQDKQRAK